VAARETPVDAAARGPRSAGQTVLAALVLVGAIVWWARPAQPLDFTGDDFELIAMARIGGLPGAVLDAPNRGTFVKPAMNALWAVLLPAIGTDPERWHWVLLATHAACALVLGMLAAALARGLGAAPPARAAACGFAAAALWGLHDRLGEPLRSVAAWNHSFTFLATVCALLALEAALARRSRPALLGAMLLGLIALLSYEVGLSLIVSAPLLVLLHRTGSLRDRVRFAAPAFILLGALYGIARFAIRRGDEAGYYRFVTWDVCTRAEEVLLAFLRLRGVAPGTATAHAVLGVVLCCLALSWLLLRRVWAFSLTWAAAAVLLIAPIPVFADRYDYIPFAELSIAAGALASRFAVTRRGVSLVGCTLLAVLLAAHAAAGRAGMRRDAVWDAERGAQYRRLVTTTEAALAHANGHPSAPMLLVWEAEPEVPPAGRPAYVRPDGVRGLVYHPDLMNFLGADSGRFFRIPPPDKVARALHDGAQLRVLDLRRDPAAGPAAETLPGKAGASMAAHDAVPRRLSAAEAGSGPALTLAWIEETDRAGAWHAEFDPPR